MAEPMEMVRAEPQQIELRVPHGMMVERPPAEVLAEARKAAQALGDVISGKKKKVVMNGEQYLEFEDWQTLGHFYGVTAGEDGDPEHVTINEVNGFKASAVAYRHGQAISRATQYCMADEPNWRNKPLFQLSSMAQTRACAKVLRNVLAWVVVLAGYKPTPAEEMENLTKVEDNHQNLTPASIQDNQLKATPAFTEKLKEVEGQNATQQQFAQPRQFNGNVISEPQAKRLFAISKKAGWSDAEIKDKMQNMFGFASSRDITRDKYELICKYFEEGGKPPAPVEDESLPF